MSRPTVLVVNEAEKLILIAEEILRKPTGPTQVIECVGGCTTGYHIDLAALAIKFTKAPTGLRFRAMVECWDRQRIIRELH